jgi:hypothetical protein
VEELGVDHARVDDVDEHVAAAQGEVHLHGLGPCGERGLRRRVRRLARRAEARRDRRDVHDAAVALHELGEQRQREVDGGEVVDAHHGLDDVGRERLDLPALRDAGVVHEHVDAAELLARELRERRDRVEVGEVDRPHAAVGRVLAAALERLPQPVLAARADAHGRALLREALCERGADPGRSTGHEHVLAVQRVRHGSPSRFLTSASA